MWNLLKKSQKRHECDKVIFYPALHPYDGVPERRRQQLLNGNDLNLFTKLGITEPEAREYCLEHGILRDEDFESGHLTNAGMDKLCEANQCILDHQRLIICRDNEEDFRYLLCHQAHMVQRPWEKPKVAIVMRSDGKGAGKGVLVHHNLHIVGSGGASKHAEAVSDANAVLGDFNGARSGKILLVLDEAYWAGSKRDKGKLRNLVTEETHDIRLMHTNPYTEESFMRIWFASNDIHVVPFDEGERRFKLFELDNRYAGVTTEETKAYFDPLWKLPHEVYAMFLYHYDITGFDPRSFKIGAAEQAQMAASLDLVQTWYKNCLDRGYIAVEESRRQPEDLGAPRGEVPHVRLWPFGGLAVPKSIMYDDYKRFCAAQREKIEPNSTWARQLRLLTQIEDVRKSQNYGGVPEKQPYCLRLQTLGACRRAWVDRFGEDGAHGWDEGAGLDEQTLLRPCPEWTLKP